jgi:hypothetical protein
MDRQAERARAAQYFYFPPLPPRVPTPVGSRSRGTTCRSYAERAGKGPAPPLGEAFLDATLRVVVSAMVLAVSYARAALCTASGSSRFYIAERIRARGEADESGNMPEPAERRAHGDCTRHRMKEERQAPDARQWSTADGK